jgi:hypothetical protein
MLTCWRGSIRFSQPKYCEGRLAHSLHECCATHSYALLAQEDPEGLLRSIANDSEFRVVGMLGAAALTRCHFPLEQNVSR